MSEPKEQNTTEEPKSEPNTVKKVSKVFAFKLNEKDLAAKAVLLGELHAELEAADRELTAAKEEYKQTASAIAVARSSAVDAIRTGKEYRDTECEEVQDFNTNRVYWRRKSETASDMWEVLEERAMTPQERQLALNLSDKKGGEYEEAAKGEAPGSNGALWDPADEVGAQ